MSYGCQWRPDVASWRKHSSAIKLALLNKTASHAGLIVGWADSLNVNHCWLCSYAALVSSCVCARFITQSEGGVLNNNSSVLWQETAEGFSRIWTSSHKAAVWKDLFRQPPFITSLHPGQHTLLWRSSVCYITRLHPAFECLFVCVSECVCLLCADIYQFPSGVMRQQPTTGTSNEDRWWTGSWPLTPVIRYGRSNWLAVFSINRHYGPLCQPAPLAALLFLEAAERLFSLPPPYRSSLYHRHCVILDKKHLELATVMRAFAWKFRICSHSHLLLDLWSAQSTWFYSHIVTCNSLKPSCMVLQYTVSAERKKYQQLYVQSRR